MDYIRCPTSIVNAPVELVWRLLTQPEGWGKFYDVRILAVDPAGSAVVGQTVFAESGPNFLHLRLHFHFVEIDSSQYRLGIDGRFPLGVGLRKI